MADGFQFYWRAIALHSRPAREYNDMAALRADQVQSAAGGEFQAQLDDVTSPELNVKEQLRHYESHITPWSIADAREFNRYLRPEDMMDSRGLREIPLHDDWRTGDLIGDGEFYRPNYQQSALGPGRDDVSYQRSWSVKSAKEAARRIKFEVNRKKWWPKNSPRGVSQRQELFDQLYDAVKTHPATEVGPNRPLMLGSGDPNAYTRNLGSALRNFREQSNRAAIGIGYRKKPASLEKTANAFRAEHRSLDYLDPRPMEAGNMGIIERGIERDLVQEAVPQRYVYGNIESAYIKTGPNSFAASHKTVSYFGPSNFEHLEHTFDEMLANFRNAAMTGNTVVNFNLFNEHEVMIAHEILMDPLYQQAKIKAKLQFIVPTSTPYKGQADLLWKYIFTPLLGVSTDARANAPNPNSLPLVGAARPHASLGINPSNLSVIQVETYEQSVEFLQTTLKHDHGVRVSKGMPPGVKLYFPGGQISRYDDGLGFNSASYDETTMSTYSSHIRPSLTVNPKTGKIAMRGWVASNSALAFSGSLKGGIRFESYIPHGSGGEDRMIETRGRAVTSSGQMMLGVNQNIPQVYLQQSPTVRSYVPDGIEPFDRYTNAYGRSGEFLGRVVNITRQENQGQLIEHIETNMPHDPSHVTHIHSQTIERTWRHQRVEANHGILTDSSLRMVARINRIQGPTQVSRPLHYQNRHDPLLQRIFKGKFDPQLALPARPTNWDWMNNAEIYGQYQAPALRTPKPGDISQFSAVASSASGPSRRDLPHVREWARANSIHYVLAEGRKNMARFEEEHVSGKDFREEKSRRRREKKTIQARVRAERIKENSRIRGFKATQMLIDFDAPFKTRPILRTVSTTEDAVAYLTERAVGRSNRNRIPSIGQRAHGAPQLTAPSMTSIYGDMVGDSIPRNLSVDAIAIQRMLLPFQTDQKAQLSPEQKLLTAEIWGRSWERIGEYGISAAEVSNYEIQGTSATDLFSINELGRPDGVLRALRHFLGLTSQIQGGGDGKAAEFISSTSVLHLLRPFELNAAASDSLIIDDMVYRHPIETVFKGVIDQRSIGDKFVDHGDYSDDEGGLTAGYKDGDDDVHHRNTYELEGYVERISLAEAQHIISHLEQSGRYFSSPDQLIEMIHDLHSALFEASPNPNTRKRITGVRKKALTSAGDFTQGPMSLQPYEDAPILIAAEPPREDVSDPISVLKGQPGWEQTWTRPLDASLTPGSRAARMARRTQLKKQITAKDRMRKLGNRYDQTEYKGSVSEAVAETFRAPVAGALTSEQRQAMTSDPRHHTESLVNRGPDIMEMGGPTPSRLYGSSYHYPTNIIDTPALRDMPERGFVTSDRRYSTLPVEEMRAEDVGYKGVFPHTENPLEHFELHGRATLEGTVEEFRVQALGHRYNQSKRMRDILFRDTSVSQWQKMLNEHHLERAIIDQSMKRRGLSRRGYKAFAHMAKISNLDMTMADHVLFLRELFPELKNNDEADTLYLFMNEVETHTKEFEESIKKGVKAFYTTAFNRAITQKVGFGYSATRIDAENTIAAGSMLASDRRDLVWGLEEYDPHTTLMKFRDEVMKAHAQGNLDLSSPGAKRRVQRIISAEALDDKEADSLYHALVNANVINTEGNIGTTEDVSKTQSRRILYSTQVQTSADLIHLMEAPDSHSIHALGDEAAKIIQRSSEVQTAEAASLANAMGQIAALTENLDGVEQIISTSPAHALIEYDMRREGLTVEAMVTEAPSRFITLARRAALISAGIDGTDGADGLSAFGTVLDGIKKALR